MPGRSRPDRSWRSLGEACNVASAWLRLKFAVDDAACYPLTSSRPPCFLHLRPASGMSRSRKAGGWEKSATWRSVLAGPRSKHVLSRCERSDIGNSQAELWLIKQRTLAGSTSQNSANALGLVGRIRARMLWPPMSEAARDPDKPHESHEA